MRGKAKVEPSSADDCAAGGFKITRHLLEVKSLDDNEGLGGTAATEGEPDAEQETLTTEISSNANRVLEKQTTVDLFKSSGDLCGNGGPRATRTLSASSDSAMDKKTKRKSSPETNTPKRTPKIVNFFKRKLHVKRGNSVTSVKEISITPEEDDDRWASRNVEQHSSSSSGANSRTSSGGTDYRSTPENPNVVTVHDMDNEYNPEYR